MEILNSIIILLAVILGFYLGRFSEINKKVGDFIQEVKPKPKGYGEPFTISPNEYKLEQEQLKKKETEEMEKEISIATGK